jgi:hypothetical protein
MPASVSESVTPMMKRNKASKSVFILVFQKVFGASSIGLAQWRLTLCGVVIFRVLAGIPITVVTTS